MYVGVASIVAFPDWLTVTFSARLCPFPPLAAVATIENAAVVEADSLVPVARAVSRCRIVAAARLGGVRLIDNLPLEL